MAVATASSEQLKGLLRVELDVFVVVVQESAYRTEEEEESVSEEEEEEV